MKLVAKPYTDSPPPPPVRSQQHHVNPMFAHGYAPLSGDDPNAGADELATFSMTPQNNGDVVVDMQAVGVGIGPRFGVGSRPQRSAYTLRRGCARGCGGGDVCMWVGGGGAVTSADPDCERACTPSSRFFHCFSGAWLLQLMCGRGHPMQTTCVRWWTWGSRRSG